MAAKKQPPKPPTKFTMTDEQKIEYLGHIAMGMRRGAAADMLELPKIQVREYIFENPDFERLVLDAEVDATEAVEEALFHAAISGNVTACKIWMEMKGYSAAPSAASRGAAPTPTVPPGGGVESDDLFGGPVVDIRTRRANQSA